MARKPPKGAKVWVVLTDEGARALMSSRPMEEGLLDHAKGIAERASQIGDRSPKHGMRMPMYRASVEKVGDRAQAIVYTNSEVGKANNARHNSILKAMGEA